MDISKVSQTLAATCPGFVDSVELFIKEIGFDSNQDKFKNLSYFGSTRSSSIKILLKEWICKEPGQTNISSLIKVLIKIKFCSEQIPLVNGIIKEVEDLQLKTTPGECVICQKPTDLKCMVCSVEGLAPDKIPYYCGKEHQIEHWKKGHKISCGKSQIKSKPCPNAVTQLLELDKNYAKLGPSDILEERQLQVIAEILSDDTIVMDNWREVMSNFGVNPDKYDEWKGTISASNHLIVLKTLMEWPQTEKTLDKLTQVLGHFKPPGLSDLIEYGFSYGPIAEPNIETNYFKKDSIVCRMQRNLSQEEIERIVSIHFEVPYANLDILDEIVDCGKLVEESVKNIFVLVGHWDKDEMEQCTNIYKMLMNPEYKIIPYAFCLEGDVQLERLIVTVELKEDDRLQGFGRHLMTRKYRNVFVE